MFFVHCITPPAFPSGFEQITNPALDKCGGPDPLFPPDYAPDFNCLVRKQVMNGDSSHRQLFSHRIMKSYPRSYDPDSILAADNGSIWASLNS